MKVVFLLESFPCLSETFILNQIVGFIEAGCNVGIVALNRSRDDKQHADISKYNLLEKTTYVNVPPSKMRKRVSAALGTLCASAKHPVETYLLQKRLLQDCPACDYTRFFVALTLMQSEPFDVVQCHYGKMGNLAIILKDMKNKARISTVFHGYDISLELARKGPDLYRELFLKGDVFLPVSRFWKQRLVELGCPAEKITVNHMGIDTEKFKPVSRPARKAIKILTVARLVEKKGHRYALEAFRQAIRIMPNLEYHIAGDGPLREDIKDLAHNLGIDKYITFHGRIDASEALDLYKHADIFLLPSVTSSDGDMEGIPVSLMEAMACGLPVIASRHSGVPELVTDGQTGFLVAERDTQSIAEKLIALAGNTAKRLEIGKLARKQIETNFDSRKLARETIDLFKDLKSKC